MLRLSELGTLVAHYDQLGEVFYALDADWRIAVANDTALRFAGATRAAAIGRSYWDVVPAARGSALQDAFVSAVRDRRIVHVDVEATLQPGRYVRAVATPLEDGLGVALRDITDERAAAAASRRRLQEAEEHLRTAAEVAAIGTSEIDHETHRRYWSPQFREILGLRPDADPSEALFLQLVAGEDRDRVQASLAAAQSGANEGRYAMEYRIRRASDGAKRWVSTRGRVFFDAAGRPLRRISAVYDVTSRKQAEEALRESEAKFRHLANSAPALIWLTDEAGTLAFANTHFTQVFGRPAESLVPRGWRDVIHPEDLKSFVADFATSFRTHRSFAREVRVLDNLGQVRWLRTDAVPRRSEEGVFLGYTGFGVDVTDSKEAQHRLGELNQQLEFKVRERTLELQASEETALRLYNRSPAPQHSIDAQGRYLAVSDGWLELMGYSREEVLGRPFFDFVADFELERLRTAFVRLRAEGEIRDFEYNLLARDGTLRPVLVTTRVEYDQHGEFLRSYGVTLDLRARKAAEAALAREADERRRAEESLRQAQKMEAVGELTGGVAHDFNNLLTIIRSSADLLRRPNLPEERRQRYMEAISATVERASKLTAQLLAFARRQTLKPEVFEVGERIQAISDMLQTTVGPRIQLLCEFEEEPTFVRADVPQFETALVNMAVNARDAMDGEGTLRIRVRCLPDAEASHDIGDIVAVSLTDTGTGIPADQLPHVFDPFFTTKEVGKGTGLGLSQVYGFAKQSGGDIGVETAVGHGTTFTLKLPRSHEAPSAAEQEAEAGPQPASGRRVLLVEDDEEVGLSSSDVLHDLGYVATLARSGAEALRILSSHPGAFDVVFSDVLMPGMSGVELARAIRQSYPELPVVLTSGYSQVLAEEGSHGFELLRKPYAPADLSRVLGRAAREPTRACCA